MAAILVAYASREGHTARIAQRLVAALADAGTAARAVDLRATPAPDLAACDGLLLVASAHGGRFEREMVRFVRSHRPRIDAMAHAFLPVSLSQAGVQRSDATPEAHARFVHDVAKLDESFFAATGWRAKEVHRVAGALLYTRYNWLIRRLMKRIARLSGGSVDTRRDHDYTDWSDVDRFAQVFAAKVIHSAATTRVAEGVPPAHD